MKTKRQLLSLATLVLAIACAKDKDADSYRREKTQENLARLQVAEGSYTGLVHSQSDGAEMGAMEIQLKAETRTRTGANQSGGSGASAESEAVLVATVRFVGNRTTSATSYSSYFDPDKKDFNAQINISTSSGRLEQVAINGLIPGDTFEGTIGVTNYPGYGGKFVLKKNGAAPESLISEANYNRGSDQPLYAKTFRSVTTFFKDGSKSVRNTVPADMIILQPSVSAEQDFLNIFSPLKVVMVTMNYQDSLKLLHENAVWDQRSGTLTGSTVWRNTDNNPDTSGRDILNLSCVSRGLDDRMAWNCSHSSSGVGIIATTESYYDNRIVSDTVGATTAPVIVNFPNGTAKFVDRAGNHKTARAKLRAMLPTRNRADRLLELFFPVKVRNLHLTLTLTFSMPVPVNYTASKTFWDIANSTLQASESSGTPNQPIDSTLSCSGFNFDQTRQAFNCEYFATHAADTFFIRFEPAQP